MKHYGLSLFRLRWLRLLVARNLMQLVAVAASPPKGDAQRNLISAASATRLTDATLRAGSLS